MKLSAQELNQLVDSKAFEGVPTALALEEGDLSWEGMIDNIRQQAARTIIWEAGQRISTLFDAYGEAIEEVSLAFDEGYDNGPYPYFDISIIINGAFCCDGDISLPAETMAMINDVDEGSLLDETVKFLDYMAPPKLIKEIDRFKKAFEAVIEDADEGRARAAKAAPSTEAWVKKHLLEQTADLPERANTGRRGPKHKM